MTQIELTVDQALQQGIAAHKEGKLQDAERLYRAILQTQPNHPDANHNLGVLAASVGKPLEAIPFFKLAVEANPQIEQFWLSYIDALITVETFDEANRVLVQGEKAGLSSDKLDAFKPRLGGRATNDTNKVAPRAEPSQDQINRLVEHYQTGSLGEAKVLATLLTQQFPKHPFGWKVLGAVFKRMGRLNESLLPMQKSIDLSPQDAEAHSNLGSTLNELGRLGEAEASYKQAVALESDFAEACWNLHGIQKTIKSAEHWIDKCLDADENHVKARLTKAALRFYQGDKNYFTSLMRSEFKQHPYIRSFSWAFSLPTLPELHFNKFYFLDAIVRKSITARPFYEFGVWRASSFRYLIKVFKKGYGFDTFTGLPEEWHVGSRIEKEGTYTSDGNVPKIPGGEFIVGKFEDTLPVFFSESRPVASVINFDADLYSSTICALNFSKSVMDKDTILVFDELIINESWEHDEFKALTEFCSNNQYTYEVIAVSFCTKQVALKLIGI